MLQSHPLGKHPSLLVKLCEIGTPPGGTPNTNGDQEGAGVAGRERRPQGDQVYYYQGADFIYRMEERLKAEFADFVGASDVETRR